MWMQGINDTVDLLQSGEHPRPDSARYYYRAATPALNEKLQAFRDSPQALAALHQRIKQQAQLSKRQHAQTSSPQSPAGEDANNKCHIKPSKNFVENNAKNISPWPCTGETMTRAAA